MVLSDVLTALGILFLLKLCYERKPTTPFLGLASLLYPLLMFSLSKQVVFAQAPVNDVVSWPPGLLLLATIMYAAIATAPDLLWEIEPCTGFFLANGLPKISIPGMKRVTWVANACHFVPGIRSAPGISNFWVRANEISVHARTTALNMVLKTMHCVFYEEVSPYDSTLWNVTPAGLVVPVGSTSSIGTSPSKEQSTDIPLPSSRDFLLFAAIDYHAFRAWHVEVYSAEKLLFSTNGMPPSSVIDVESAQEALPVVVAQMVRRPHSQSPLRAIARKTEPQSDTGPYIISLEDIPRNSPACFIDFHSYAPEGSKVSATIEELASAYYNVVRYIKRRAPDAGGSSPHNQVARIDVGQALWISILGGAIFDRGRLTIQNLPGRMGVRDATADEVYLGRLEVVLRLIEPHGSTSTFNDLVYSNGIARRSAYPFFIAGIFAQAITSYFLTVGTSAGVWTSLSLANSLFNGRLTDIHSLFWGKTASTNQPGLKMYVPGSTQLMVVATFDRTTPRPGQGGLRPGFILNAIGLVASILGAIFQIPTRDALGFSPFAYTPPWVVYTSITLCLGMSILIAVTIIFQQVKEKTWSDDSELPTRWIVYSTLISSLIISGLAIFFFTQKHSHLWPVLDTLIFLSGVPLGVIENGYLVSMDLNTLHMLLVNRWMMGAVASALGSVAR